MVNNIPSGREGVGNREALRALAAAAVLSVALGGCTDVQNGARGQIHDNLAGSTQPAGEASGNTEGQSALPSMNGHEIFDDSFGIETALIGLTPQGILVRITVDKPINATLQWSHSHSAAPVDTQVKQLFPGSFTEVTAPNGASFLTVIDTESGATASRGFVE